MRPRYIACAATIAAFALPVSRQARADDKSADGLRAEALFEAARILMTQGAFAQACPKFADSQALDPAPGTILNLAVCYEREDRLASAWSAFRTAEATAVASGQKARAELAHKRSEALQPRLSRLTVNVPMDAQVIGLEIRVNGEAIRETDWGVPIPHDGGAYALEVTANGKKTWTRQFELNAGGESMELSVPVLQDAPPAPAPPPELVTPQPLPVLQPIEPPSPALDDLEKNITLKNEVRTTVTHPGTPQRTVGLIIGAAGVVTMGAAGLVGLTARSKFDHAVSEEPSNSAHTDSVGAFNTGNVGTLLFGAGALVTLVGGGVWLTAPKDTTVFVGVAGGGVVVRGSFR